MTRVLEPIDDMVMAGAPLDVRPTGGRLRLMFINFKSVIAKALLFTLAFACLLTVLSQGAFAQTGETTVLFSDDFETGNADGWELETGWGVEIENGNHVLSGKGHTWAGPVRPEGWGIITSFETRIKRLEGSSHLNFRLSPSGTRYFVGVYGDRLSLQKSIFKDPVPTEGDPFNHIELTGVELRLSPAWHAVKIVGDGNNLKVYLDGQLKIDYTDEKDSYLSGSVAFETLDGSHFYFDDIVITGQPPPPAPLWTSDFIWTFTGGPRGGIGYDIRINPVDNSILWVTDANAGVHRSTDAGLHWEAMNSGITARTGFSGDAIPIFSLAIDPNNPEIMWAGTLGMRAVFKSIDGGKTWTRRDRGIEEHPVTEIRSFTIEPNNSNVVYMGGNYRPDPQKLEERGFVYKTIDGGKQWTKILEPGALVRWILVDPTDTNVIYVATGIFDRIAVKPEGILKSTDGGRTWFSINDGLTSLSVGGLAMHPQNPEILFATTGKASAFLNEERELYGAVFKTTDGGQHWRKVYPAGKDIQIRYSAVAFAPNDPNIVYVDAGHEFLRSTDGGENWERFDVSSRAMKGEWRGTPIALAVHPQNPNLIYMNAYDGGVFRSDDGGRSWVDASAGYSGSQSWDIVVNPNNPGYVVVGSKNGVHTSFDGAQTWQGRNTEGWINNILSIAMDPTTPEKILVGNEISGWIRMTTDGGATWQEVLPALGVDTIAERISIYQIAFAPSQPGTVYAATGIASLTIGFYKETPGRGVYKSTNGGRNWFPVNHGLEATRLNILTIAVGPHNPNLVYIGTLDSGVFKSEDGGANWVKTSSGILAAEIRSVTIDPSNPDVVYVGTENAALFKSVDGGKTWGSSSAGMDPGASVRSIVIDPSNPETVYAADRRTGVYRSVDSGKLWTQINQGLRMRAINRLAISSDGKILYAATEGGGVFRIGEPPEVVATPTVPPPTPQPPVATTPPAPQPPETREPAPATEKIISVLPYLGGGLLLLVLIGWGLWRLFSRRKMVK